MEFPIDIPLGEKLKRLRLAEGLSQQALCDIVGIAQGSYKNLESGRNKSANLDFIQKIISHPRFVKYAVWLLFDQITEEQAQQALEFLRQQDGYVEPPPED